MGKQECDFTNEEEMKTRNFFDDVHNFIKENFVNEYIAFYIYKLYIYQFSDTYRTPLVYHINSAMEANFNGFGYEDINLDKIKEILKLKYNLALKSIDPFILEEL